MPRDNNVPSQFKRELTMTEDEEMVLVEMSQFFIENGWINEESQDAFDSLIDKVCEPSPFDYV
jgi:hypothetical protein